MSPADLRGTVVGANVIGAQARTPATGKEIGMAAKPIPGGDHAITPYLMVAGAQKFIDFMTTVFGASVREQMKRPDGRIGHTELVLGDSMVMLSEADSEHAPTPVMLHVHVDDVDAALSVPCAQATAGATMRAQSLARTQQAPREAHQATPALARSARLAAALSMLPSCSAPRRSSVRRSSWSSLPARSPCTSLGTSRTGTSRLRYSRSRACSAPP
jgi:uncharacterized glyoxalase superfamily protein PhnB